MAPAFSANNSDAKLTLNGSDIKQSEPQTVFLNENINGLIVQVISGVGVRFLGHTSGMNS